MVLGITVQFAMDFILGQARIGLNFFGISLLRKQVFLYLLRGSFAVAYVFRGLFMLMQYFKKVCGKNVSLHQNFSSTTDQQTVWKLSVI